MSGRDWRERIRNAVPWVVFLVSMTALVVSGVAWYLQARF